MITNCRQCGHYTIVPGQEVAGLLDVVRKLRSDVDGKPMGQSGVQQQAQPLRRLHFEIEMLLARMNIDVWDMPVAPAQMKGGVVMASNIATSWTEEKKARVIQLLEANHSFSEIAADLGMSRSAVGGWISRNGLCRSPSGRRPEITEALIQARKERHRIVSLESKHRRAGTRVVYLNRKSPPATPFNRRHVDVVPMHLSFDDMKFGKFCAYPTHEPNTKSTYCGHGVGLRKNGKPSPYCQSHHFVVHA